MPNSDEMVDVVDELDKDASRNTPELFGAAMHFVIKAFYPELSD